MLQGAFLIWYLLTFGSVVFPLALLVEAPIIMLLAAATALVRDRDSYRKLHRFTFCVAAVICGPGGETA